MPETRTYPESCQSRFCGNYGNACNSCKHKPALDEFVLWIHDHKAINLYPITNQTIYTSTKN